jgi:hypothetical protein
VKILLGNEELEVIEAGTNQVVFYAEGNGESEDEDAGDEEDEPMLELEPLLYKIKLYKNNQAQTVDRTIKVKAANLSVQALTELSSVLILINSKGQAVYTVAWDLVHSVDSEEA